MNWTICELKEVMCEWFHENLCSGESCRCVIDWHLNDVYIFYAKIYISATFERDISCIFN